MLLTICSGPKRFCGSDDAEKSLSLAASCPLYEEGESFNRFGFSLSAIKRRVDQLVSVKDFS